MQTQDIPADIPVPEGWEIGTPWRGNDGLLRFRIHTDEGSTILSGPRAPLIEGYKCFFVGHTPTWTSYSYVEVTPCPA